jgi:ABC-type Fe3+ transport system substrate-binding protein
MRARPIGGSPAWQAFVTWLLTPEGQKRSAALSSLRLDPMANGAMWSAFVAARKTRRLSMDGSWGDMVLWYLAAAGLVVFLGGGVIGFFVGLAVARL